MLITHVTNFDQAFGSNVTGIASRLTEYGYTGADATVSAVAQVGAIVRQQATMAAFLDCFWILGVIALIGPLLAIFIRKFNQCGEPPAH